MERPAAPKLSASDREALASARRFVASSQFNAITEAMKAWAPYVDQVEDTYRTALDRHSEIALTIGDLGLVARQTWGLIAFFPDNLWSVLKEPESYASPALDDGIPVAWVVPPDLLKELVEAPPGADRRVLLLDRRDQLLAGCADVLKRRPGRWSGPALEAVEAAAAGHGAAAQSHAANILDSVVLVEYADELNPDNNRKARERAKLMSEADLDEREKLLLGFACELTSLPFKHALAQWFPGNDPPNTFNRHATAHCVGESKVYSETHCLIAVMLATSLACQYPIDPGRKIARQPS